MNIPAAIATFAIVAFFVGIWQHLCTWETTCKHCQRVDSGKDLIRLVIVCCRHKCSLSSVERSGEVETGGEAKA